MYKGIGRYVNREPHPLFSKKYRKKKTKGYWGGKNNIVERKLRELSNGDEALYQKYKKNLMELRNKQDTENNCCEMQELNGEQDS